MLCFWSSNFLSFFQMPVRYQQKYNGGDKSGDSVGQRLRVESIPGRENHGQQNHQSCK